MVVVVAGVVVVRIIGIKYPDRMHSVNNYK